MDGLSGFKGPNKMIEEFHKWLEDPTPEKLENAKELVLDMNISQFKQMVFTNPLNFTQAVAARHGIISICELLLQQAHTAINHGGKGGNFPLHVAIKSMHPQSIDIMRLFLDHGANVELKAMDGCTALLKAVESQQLDKVRLLLLKHGCNLREHSNGGNTALHKAVLKGDIDIVKELLDYGADVNIEDYPGATTLIFINRKQDMRPQHMTCLSRSNGSSIAKLLLAHGARIDAPTKSGRTALHRAAFHNCPALTETLIMAGANINARELSSNGAWTPLHRAVDGNAKEQYVEVVRLLCEAGADVNALDTQNNAPLNLAFETHPKLHQLETVITLIQYGAKVNSINAIGRTPLGKCVFDIRYYKYIGLLVEAGARLIPDIISKAMTLQAGELEYGPIHLVAQPPSLQQCCRDVVRCEIMSHFGRGNTNLLKCIDRLKMPRTIRDFIKMENLRDFIENDDL